jgi:hypothetical protein
MKDQKLEQRLKELVRKRSLIGFGPQRGNEVVIYVSISSNDDTVINELRREFPNINFIVKKIGDVRAYGSQ